MSSRFYKRRACSVSSGDGEYIEGLSVVMRQLEDEGYIPLGGMVRPQYYEHARKANEYFKQEFVDLAENESQKEMHAKVWPYQ